MYAVAPALPTGLSLDPATGILSGTPTAASPVTTYTVTATNSAGSTTAQVVISVTAGTPPIQAPANLTYASPLVGVIVNTPMTPDLPNNTGGVVSSYSVNPSLPAGLALDPNTGTISGTPTAKAPAATFTVTAANATGSSTAEVVIAVYAPATTSFTSLSLLAGMVGGPGYLDGMGAAARFNSPQSVAVDTSGNLYVADTNNSVIRKITPNGVVTTLAGNPGHPGSSDGAGSLAGFRNPSGIAVDGGGNVYVADTNNCTIRKVSPGGQVSTLAGKALGFGYLDGTGNAARFRAPGGVAVDGSGNVFVADTRNNTIRQVRI